MKVSIKPARHQVPSVVMETMRAGARGYLLRDQTPEPLVKQLCGITEGYPPLSPSVARRLLDHFRIEQKTSCSRRANARCWCNSRAEAAMQARNMGLV